MGHLQNIVESIYNLPASQIAKTQYMFCMENWKLHKRNVCNHILVMPMTIFGSKLRCQQKADSRWEREPMIWLGGRFGHTLGVVGKPLDEFGSLGGDFVIFGLMM